MMMGSARSTILHNSGNDDRGGYIVADRVLVSCMSDGAAHAWFRILAVVALEDRLARQFSYLSASRGLLLVQVLVSSP